MDWNQAREKIACDKTASQLVDVIEKAEKWNLRPDDFLTSSLDNLRLIVTDLRRMVRYRQIERFNALLHKAATMDNVKFRRFLGMDPAQVANVRHEHGRVILTMSEAQYKVIRSRIRQIDLEPDPHVEEYQ